jgi:hypothetical protein
MPYPKTVTEIQTAKAKLESQILHLVKDFEFETATAVDQILCYGPEKTTGRVSTRVTINSMQIENAIDKAGEVVV